MYRIRKNSDFWQIQSVILLLRRLKSLCLVAMATMHVGKKIRLNILIMWRPYHILKVSWKSEIMSGQPHLKYSGFYLFHVSDGCHGNYVTYNSNWKWKYVLFLEFNNSSKKKKHSYMTYIVYILLRSFTMCRKWVG